MDPHIEELLHAGRVQHRDHQVGEAELGLMRGGRGFAGVVVAGQQQDAAMLRGAGEIAVPQHVAGPVDAGAFRVPHGENAVIGGVREQVELLAAPDRGRGEVFVDAGLEMDVVLLDERLGLPQLLVERA